MRALNTVTEHLYALAANLPSGRIWMNKTRPGSNLYSLLEGIAPSFQQMDSYCQEFIDESFPFTPTKFLEEREAALGLPDECFSVRLTDHPEYRRFNIIVKLRITRGVQTADDFKEIATLYGFDYEFHSGIDHVTTIEGGYGAYSPAIALSSFTGGDVQGARNTLVVVTGDATSINFGNAEDSDGADGIGWQFPLAFSADGQDRLNCIIRMLAPAHNDVMFVEE